MDMPTAQSLRLPQRLSALRAPLEQFLSAAVGFVMSGASILLAAAPFGRELRRPITLFPPPLGRWADI